MQHCLCSDLRKWKTCSLTCDSHALSTVCLLSSHQQSETTQGRKVMEEGDGGDILLKWEKKRSWERNRRDSTCSRVSSAFFTFLTLVMVLQLRAANVWNVKSEIPSWLNTADGCQTHHRDEQTQGGAVFIWQFVTETILCRIPWYTCTCVWILIQLNIMWIKLYATHSTTEWSVCTFNSHILQYNCTDWYN